MGLLPYLHKNARHRHALTGQIEFLILRARRKHDCEYRDGQKRCP
jgi:hypothetical protein